MVDAQKILGAWTDTSKFSDFSARFLLSILILLKTFLFITQLMAFSIPVDTENKGKTFLFTQLSVSE